MATGRCVYNEIVPEPFSKENNAVWFGCVKNYLIARDLWEVVEGSIARPSEDEDHREEFVSWRRKNAAALHVIYISCTPDSLALLVLFSEAKVAWDVLNQVYLYYNPLQTQLQPHQVTATQVDYDVKVLYKAICDNSWHAAKEFIDEHGPSALSAILTPLGQTALHVAAQYGHVGIVEELVKRVPPEHLEIVDSHGLTPLFIAAYTGVTKVAECMVNKNSNILSIQLQIEGASLGALPVTLAFAAGHKEMGYYLYSVTPLQVLRPENGPPGPRLLRACFISRYLDVALDLLQRCKELLFATVNNEDQSTPVIGIAAMASAFPSGSQLVFWKQWIYNCISIQSTTTIKDVRVDIQQEGISQRIQGFGVLHRFISKAYSLSGMKEIYEQKLVHAQSAQILSLVCESVYSTVLDTKQIIASRALFRAAQEGNVEFVEQVAKANPHLMLLITGSSGWHTFYFAVKHRQAKVFNLIHGYRFKRILASGIDNSGNGLLHVAGMLASSSILNRISGAALQMQRELQWFKEVESVVPPTIRVLQNSDGMKPEDLFKESHKELRIEGEKWMKETASSCSVVGALVVTIMFASAFTVPGGNNQESGYPIFLHRENKLFMLFLISDALSLFSSTTSVLMFLGILTSRYSEEDFLKSLPTKLIIGLSALFLSIATMTIAFSATLLILLQHKPHSSAFLPVCMLASVPVILFVLLQFPLLVQMVSSTYGPGIFKRNAKPWP